MRRTVSCEMLPTTPSASNWRASSTQSHLAREQPSLSGRSQAILTRWSATSGGKDRRASPPPEVVQAVEALPSEAYGPLAGVADGHPHGGGGLLGGGAAGNPRQPPAPPGPARRSGGGTQPALQVRTLGLGNGQRKGLFAAAHGDTECDKDGLRWVEKICSLSPICS